MVTQIVVAKKRAKSPTASATEGGDREPSVGIATHLAELDLVKVPGSLGVDIEGQRYGHVGLWRLWGHSCEFSMQPPRGTDPEVSFVFVESGIISARTPGEAWRSLDAPLIVVPTVRSRRIRIRGAWSVTVAKLPLRAVEAYVPFVPNSVGVFKSTRMLDSAMHRFVAAVLQASSPGSAVESSAIEQLAMEMAGAVLLDRTGPEWAQGTPHDVLRDRALGLISQECADPGLTPARIAAGVHASLRQLQAVFAESGTSIALELRRARARAAHTLLSDSRFDALSVEQVAEKSGFATSMSLRRATEAVYRQSPRAVRESRRHEPA